MTIRLKEDERLAKSWSSKTRTQKNHFQSYRMYVSRNVCQPSIFTVQPVPKFKHPLNHKRTPFLHHQHSPELCSLMTLCSAFSAETPTAPARNQAKQTKEGHWSVSSVNSSFFFSFQNAAFSTKEIEHFKGSG